VIDALELSKSSASHDIQRSSDAVQAWLRTDVLPLKQLLGDDGGQSAE
jgi:hypothetical protein